MLEQQLVNALSLGCVYALFALGFTLVFGVLGVINLSHGAIFMLGAYTALQVVTKLSFPLWASLVAAFVVSGAIGLAIDVLVLKPLRRRNAPHLIPMIATIGIAIFFNNAAQGGFGAENQRFPSELVPDTQLHFAGMQISVLEVAIIVLSFALMAGLLLLMRKTQLGRALRAIAESPKAAALLGINVEGLFYLTSFSAAALGGVSGVLIALYSNAVFPLMGQPMLHKGIAVIILGGMGDIRGALLGGLFLGFAEVLSVAYIGSTMRDAVAFGLLFIVLLLRPQGMFGKVLEKSLTAMDWLDNFWSIYSNLVLTVGINALLALSIWLTLSCGLLAMANAAFMGIGAYTASILTMSVGAPFPVALAGGIAAPTLVALVIGGPTLRLSGVYLAMATLGFGEVVRVLILNAEALTGGALGLNGIPQSTQWWHVVLALVAVLLILWRLRRSRIGRAFEAIKEDAVAASLMGIGVMSHKMLAFALGAGIAGLAGALNAHLTFFIGPAEFGFDRGVDILTMTILGGTGGLTGPVLGALIVTLLPELLRGFRDFRTMMNGAILVFIVLFLPKGLWDPQRFRQWFARAPRKPAAPVGSGGALMLTLANVSKRFGGLSVLQDVSFTVPAGQVFGLIGPNGAGKTTVFNLITGLLSPSGGAITLGGQSLVGVKPHQITRLGLGRTFQNIRIFKEMTLLENVVVGMHAHLNYGVPGWLFSLPGFRAQEQRAREQAHELLGWVGLDRKAGEIADNLSYGEQRKLELARALATKPKLLLLDEPVAGMNTGEKVELMGEIANIAKRGFTIFMIEHDMRFVMGLCQRIAVLNFGKIIAEGSPAEIKNNPDVIEAYLGREDDEVSA